MRIHGGYCKSRCVGAIQFQLLQIESIIRGLKWRQIFKILRLFEAKESDQSIAS